jgi:hypothetical protein
MDSGVQLAISWPGKIGGEPAHVAYQQIGNLALSGAVS